MQTFLHTLLARHPKVAFSAHRLLSYLQLSIVHLVLIIFCNFKSDVLPHWLHTPAAHTHARAALACRHAHRSNC